MRFPSPRAGARAAVFLLLLSSAATAPPLAAAARPTSHARVAPATSTAPAASSRGLTITARNLPPGRRTLAQIAHYYYGSRDLSFVLQAANPWLAGVSPNRNLAASRPNAVIRIPVLRGARPLGPG